MKIQNTKSIATKKAAFFLSLEARRNNTKSFSRKLLIQQDMDAIVNRFCSDPTEKISYYQLISKLKRNNKGLDWERDWQQAII